LLERADEVAAVHGKSAVVVEIDADAGEVDDAAVSRDGVGERAEQLVLNVAQGIVGFQRPAAAAVGATLNCELISVITVL